MIDALTVNRREWQRETVCLPAKYFIKNQSARYMDCDIVNLSRSGAGVYLPVNENADNGTAVFLDIVMPNTLKLLTIRGRIVRTHKNDDALFVGIQFESLLPQMLFAKLI